MKDLIQNIFKGMPSLLDKHHKFQFSLQWPNSCALPPLPEDVITTEVQEFPNLLKLMPQKKNLISLKKCKNCSRRTYENTTLCRQCYVSKHGGLKRRCTHTQTKLYARGLCKTCYFLYYNYNLRVKKQKT